MPRKDKAMSAESFPNNTLEEPGPSLLAKVHSAIGEFILNARRQQNLTQTQLGGERYSKSYVSAVERDKIMPSLPALRFFAEQLGFPADYFIAQLRQTHAMRPAFAAGPGNDTGPEIDQGEGARQEGEIIALLGSLLENIPGQLTSLQHPLPFLPVLSADTIAILAAQKQALYYFIVGLQAQEKGDLAAALSAFEHALYLASFEHHPIILDKIGITHYQAQAYQTALVYHQRALHLLKQQASLGSPPPPNHDAFWWKEAPSAQYQTTTSEYVEVEIHCANAYRALGAFPEALEHYKQAHQLLNYGLDLRTAGQLHQELGYCTYVVAHQALRRTENASPIQLAEEISLSFEHAVVFLRHSTILYQASKNQVGEINARLILALVLLDLSSQRWQKAQDTSPNSQSQAPPLCSAFLAEAEENCQHVLTSISALQHSSGSLPLEWETAGYFALANLIRISVQRATLARFGLHRATILNEQARAAQLAQQVLDTFSQGLSRDLLRQALQNHSRYTDQHFSYIPRMPKKPNGPIGLLRSPIGQIEIYFAIGELAEELGREASSQDYSYTCYIQADECFQIALALVRLAIPGKILEPAALARYYQRYISTLEERRRAASYLAEDTTTKLLAILKEGRHEMQPSLLPADTKSDNEADKVG